LHGDHVLHQAAMSARQSEHTMMRLEPGCGVSYLELVTLPSAPFWARRQTNAALHAWQLHPETIETAELLVSELITNAINRPGSGHRTATSIDKVERVALTLRLMPGQVVIEVFDNDPHSPVLTYAADDAESGRGLMLVQALSKEWGHHFPPSGGKTVYCILSAPEHPEIPPECRTQEARR
jgi:anti-sigma regulatory factor (Ser/Thr protein kinase)